jgi:hypothetical protein
MNNDKNVLPADFDGVFRFTNYTNEEFKAKWNGVEYTFPPQKTTPLIIAGATPEEVQTIRKKFAKELAVSEFYKTPKFNKLNEHTPGGTPALYTDSDLAPLVQRCLEPLPAGAFKAQVVPRNEEAFLKKDEDGNNVTKVLDKKKSLLAEGAGVIA